MSGEICRVLVADDDPTVGLLMHAALAGQGFVVHVVDNGAAALLEFTQGSFDLVLLDVEMPEMDGFEVCSAMRRHAGKSVPIVLVTGHSDPQFLARAAAAGAAYIGKPVDWPGLGARLRELLDAA